MWKYMYTAAFLVAAAMVIHASFSSRSVGPDILPPGAALYSWGYYPVSAISWSGKGGDSIISMAPLEIDALTSNLAGRVNQIDVARYLVAVVSGSNVMLFDSRSWEMLLELDTGQSLRRIAIAPNLKEIAFVACPEHLISDCRLRVLEIATEGIRTIGTEEIGASSTLSWYPDGKSLLYISSDKQMTNYVISEKSSRELGESSFASYSPDGVEMAYQAERGIIIRNLQNGSEREYNANWWDIQGWRFREEPQNYALHWDRTGRFLAFTADVMKVLPDDIISPGVYSCNVLDTQTGNYVTLYEERGGTCGPWMSN